MKSWKQAVDESPNGLGYHDARNGYLNVQPDKEGGFRIDGCLDKPIQARQIPEQGVERILEKINIEPRSGWFSYHPY